LPANSVTEPTSPYLCQYDDDDKICEHFQVKEIGGGYNVLQWRESGDEAILDVSGFLLAYHLPPITPKSVVNPADRKSLNHAVNLVGLDNPQFQKARSVLQRIFNFFGDSFAEGALRGIEPATIASTDTICALTRFITPVEQNIFETAPIATALDPHAILSKLVNGRKFVYTVDNAINFMQVIRDDKKRLTRTEAFPGIFRRGQLVEASLGFRTVAIGQYHVCLTRINGLLLVNHLGSQLLRKEQEAIQRQVHARGTCLQPTQLLCCKCKDIDDDLEGDLRKRARENLAMMRALPSFDSSDALMDAVAT